MRVAYVAGPYRADTPAGIVANIRAAEAVAVELWQAGFAVVCPHKNTALFDGLAPDAVWLDGYLELLRRCDFVVAVAGWDRSAGTIRELAEADRLGIPRYQTTADAIETERRPT
jgi:nucleoside 2-deoxyribosyltransferase